MKKILVVLLLTLSVSAIAQKEAELCPCDPLLSTDIKEMYLFLDDLDTLLGKFITTFSRNKRDTTLMLNMADTIERSLRDINVRFQKNGSCFWCSVNKELGDYKAALFIMTEDLRRVKKEIKKTEASNFHVSQIISAYHYIVTSRSALMAIMDSTNRNCILQSNLSKTEKKLKRMSIVNIILTTLVGVLVITTSN